MCEIDPTTKAMDDVWHGMTALMQPFEPIPGTDKELFMPDKDANVAHAYKHISAAHQKLWGAAHRSCSCGAAAEIGFFCQECFFNSAIEGLIIGGVGNKNPGLSPGEWGKI